MAVLALASCTKKYNSPNEDIVGSSSYSQNYPARQYLMAIADNLVTDALEEIESAFWIEGLGAGSSVHFDVKEGSILTENVTWTVTGRDRDLKGMTLKNIGSDTWELTYTGPYALRGESYPVSFILKAKRGTLVKNNHYNWAVTLNGNRTEREGYACSFKTSATVLYTCDNENISGWDKLEGSYLLTVLKDNQSIDLWIMDFSGSPSKAEFRMGL